MASTQEVTPMAGANVERLHERVRRAVTMGGAESAILERIDYIENIERVIADARKDIKDAITGLELLGLSRKGIKLALARRRLAEKGELEEVDLTVARISGIAKLGIQGSLFGE